MSESPKSNLSTDLRDLRRSRSNSVVAGVLGGVGGRLGVDPLLLRIVTVVLALFGGVGIVLYALGWLLIPAEDEQTSIAERALGRDPDRPADLGTVSLAAGLVIAALLAVSGMFSSGVGWLLMILAVLGAAALMSRHDGEVPETPATPETVPGIDYPGFPGYVPSPDEPQVSPAGEPEPASRLQAPTEPEPAAKPGTEPGPAGEPGPADEPEPEPAAASSATVPSSTTPDWVSAPVDDRSADERLDASAPGWTDGPGWPEGPDWGPPQPDDFLEPVAPAPAPVEKHRSILGPVTLSVVVVALGTLAINDATWAEIPIAAYVATALAIVGAGLLVGAWFGRARGLIGLGILLALALPVSVVADGLNLESAGSVNVRPQSIAAVPDGPQEYGAGSVVYDLSDLELTDDDSITLDIEQGVGELRVIVPPNADVTVDAEVGLGGIEAFHAWSGGPGSSRQLTDLGDDGTGGGQITLNLELGVGKVEVTR